MCLTVGATGAYTEKVNYDLIEQILNKDYSYEDVDKDSEGNDVITLKNAIEEKDLNNQTINQTVNQTVNHVNHVNHVNQTKRRVQMGAAVMENVLKASVNAMRQTITLLEVYMLGLD